MRFNDDDLKTLKEEINTQKGNWIDCPIRPFLALIARLEAAEKCVEATRKWLVSLGPQEDIDLSMIKWRKAKGEE
jgi:hypothetical protein